MQAKLHFKLVKKKKLTDISVQKSKMVLVAVTY